jgi:hypothetical protein
MYLRFTSLALGVLLSTIVWSACQPVSSTPNVAVTVAQTAPPGTPLDVNTSDRDRIATALEVPSPSNMTSGDGFLWVISGSSIVRIDPKTDQIAGEPIRTGIQAEDIAVVGHNCRFGRSRRAKRK